MASTMHQDDKVSEEEPYKPDVILYYNATKGSVDTVDQMVMNYSCYMTTRRWPVVVFCNMVDVAAINAYTLWIANNPDYLDDNSKTVSARRQFLINLGMALVKPYIERRAENPTGLSHHVRKAIGQVLGKRVVDIVPENISPNQSRIRCKLCVNEACDTPGY